MSDTISLPKSELISLGLTTFLNGIFYTLFLITVIMTFYVRESSRRHHIRMLPVLSLMLVVATTHLFVLWIRGVQAFIVQKGGSALAFYDELSDATSVARVTCLVIQTVLGDLVIIWRLYIVYGQRFWVAIPPLLLVTCYTVVGSVAISYIQRARPGTDIFDVAKAWITAYFSMTMSSNVICSGAIALRIYLTWKSQSRICARLYRGIVFIIVESNALYALGVLAALVTFVSGTNGQYAAVDAIIPLVGIVFCLIAIQIRVQVDSTSNIYVYSGEPATIGTSEGRSRGNNNTTECDSEFTDNKQTRTRAIPMTIRVTSQTHVLDCLDSGDSAPYSLSGIDKDTSAAA
ncbi:hypothetical protein F5888DRAFT_1636983 [Russula emetica]|nr:hypothetical protein F5888DRAFT_1636983 [Russula emetica]